MNRELHALHAAIPEAFKASRGSRGREEGLMIRIHNMMASDGM